MALDKITNEMYENRKPCPHCGNKVNMLLRYDHTFPVECLQCKKSWTLPTEMIMQKKDPLKVTDKSLRQAIRDWNYLAEVESWRSQYWDSGDGSLMRDIDRDDDGTPIGEIGRYEIVFEFENVRYYCYLDAVTIDEAMEHFWGKHPGVTMKNVIDTMEV